MRLACYFLLLVATLAPGLSSQAAPPAWLLASPLQLSPPLRVQGQTLNGVLISPDNKVRFGTLDSLGRWLDAGIGATAQENPQALIVTLNESPWSQYIFGYNGSVRQEMVKMESQISTVTPILAETFERESDASPYCGQHL